MKAIYFIITILFFANLSFSQNNYQYINSEKIIEEGLQLHDKGKYTEAVVCYDKVIKNDSNYVWALAEKGMSLLAMKEYKKAVEICNEGLEKSTNYDSHILTNLATAYDELGESEKAINTYKKAIAITPYNNMAHFNLAVTFTGNEQHQEAIEEYKKAIECNYFHASSHYGLGLTLIEKGEYIPGMMALITFLTIEPIGNRAYNAYTVLNSIADGSIKDKEKNLSESGKNELYQEIELIIFSKIALDKKYTAKTKLKNSLAKQFQVLCEKLEYDKKSTDFYMNNYVPFLKKLYESGNFEIATYILFASTNNSKAQKWITKNEKKFIGYYEYGKESILSIISQRNKKNDGKITRFAYEYFNTYKISGIGPFKQDNTKIKTGKWTFFYVNGSKSASGTFDSKGEKNGKWTTFYQTGKVKEKFEYKDDKLNGKYSYYNENGILTIQRYYKNGKMDGKAKWYHLNGQLSADENYKNGTLTGEYKSYYKTGNLETRTSVKESYIDGKEYKYHPEGMLLSEMTYKDGVLEGEGKYYYKNGKISSVYNYKNDKPVGKGTWYYNNGNISAYYLFSEEGLQEGKSISYYRSGKMQAEGIYADNMKNGTETGYSKKGKLVYKTEYKNDVIKSYEFYDVTGKIIFKNKEKQNKLKFKSFYPNGNIESEGILLKGGKNGEWKYYYKNGKLYYSETYNDKGELHETYKSYYKNGNIETERNYKNDIETGLYTHYLINGNLSYQGWIKNGKKHYEWKLYYPDGRIMSNEYFVNGENDGCCYEYRIDGTKETEILYKNFVINSIANFDTANNMIKKALRDKTGEIKTYFHNGAISKISNIKYGIFDGSYTNYYPNGKTRMTGFYKNNVLDSTYKIYNEDSILTLEGKYFAGEQEGIWNYYYDSSKLRVTGKYTSGEETGEWKWFYENGTIRKTINYNEDGEKDGYQTEYDENKNVLIRKKYEEDFLISYSYLNKNKKFVTEIPVKNETAIVKAFYYNGKKSCEYKIKDGLIQGMQTEWHSNGKLKREMNYKDDNYEGLCKIYHLNGKLKYEQNYFSDIGHGTFIEYYSDGNLKKTTEYILGEKHGKEMHYNRTGKVTKIKNYKYDNPF